MPTFLRLGGQIFLPVFLLIQLAACSNSSGVQTGATNPASWLTPYKIEVVQGNFVSREQVEQLKVGMPREQVRELLGTPLIGSVFHADRWDYVFTLKRQNQEPKIYRLALRFKDDVLGSFSSDSMPSETEFVAQIDAKRKFGPVPVLELSEEELKTAIGKLDAAKKPSPPADEQAQVTQTPPRGSYPPLESSRW